MKKYQSDEPLITFLYNDIIELVTALMSRFVKSKHYENASFQKLKEIDLDKDENLKPYSSIQFGYLTEEEVRKALNDKKCDLSTVLSFKAQCKQMLVKLTKRLLNDKSPAAFKIVKNLKCLNPKEIEKQSVDQNCRRFKKILMYLKDLGRVKTPDCDTLHEKFRKFIERARKNGNLSTFDSQLHRIDKFYYNAMGHSSEFTDLWQVLRTLFILSHGQALVERGFSINKEVSNTNIQETSLVARRQIKDHVKNLGGLENIIITKELLQSCRNARQKYHLHLSEKKASEEKKVRMTKRKRN